MAAKLHVDNLRAAGKNVIDFTIGEPDFPTAAHIVQAGVDALMRGDTKYTAASGIPALRQAIAGKLERENQLTFKLEDIVVGSGGKHVIFNAFAATLNEGDEVVIAAPYWVSYPDMVVINGGIPVIASGDPRNALKLSPAALEAAISPKTRWVVLNTPNNPSGAVYTPRELEALCAVLLKHPEVWLLTDEIYEHFVYGAAKHVSPLNVAPTLAPRTLIVNGVSKAYAMTGWRIGYGAGPAPLIKAISMLISQSTSCSSSLGQAAAVVALNGPQNCVRDAAALFSGRRDRMVQLLLSIPGIECGVPDGAFYVFPCVSGLIGRTTPKGKVLASDVDVMMYLLEEANVATIDGKSYGMSPYLRMSFATSTELIEEGCRAIHDAVRVLI
ncbi:MAG: pyridoxal phosphate-dependent aminotransferase [Rhodoferax sp.]